MKTKDEIWPHLSPRDRTKMWETMRRHLGHMRMLHEVLKEHGNDNWDPHGTVDEAEADLVKYETEFGLKWTGSQMVDIQ